MPALIVNSNPANERVVLLGKLLHQLGQPASVVADLHAVKQSGGHARAPQTIVVIPDSEGDAELARAAVGYLESDSRGPFVIYIADAIAADTYKRLVKSQRADWVTWQSITRELPELIKAVTSSDVSDSPARVISFLPSKGGVGNTTLAREVGVHLAAGRKKDRNKVAVLDLNFQASTLADSLDLAPRLDISELIGRPERLDDRLLDVFTSKYSDKLDVFSSPTRFSKGEDVPPQVIFTLLDGLGKRYDIILLDIPHQWFPWTDNVIQGSDGVVVVGESTVPAVKQLAERVKHVEQLSIPEDRVMIVLNSCDTGYFGHIPRKGQIERTFVARPILFVPRDTKTATEAANTGKSVIEVGPRSATTKSIRRLAEWVRATAAGEKAR